MALLTLKFVTDIRDLDYEVVEFHGELDQSNLEATEAQIADLLKDFKRHYLLFDLSDMAFINSEGVGFIASTHTKLVKKNQKLLICSVKPNVAEVFELIGLSKLLPVFATVGEAIAYIKKTKSEGTA